MLNLLGRVWSDESGEKARRRVRGTQVQPWGETLEERALMAGLGGPLAHQAAIPLVALTGVASTAVVSRPVAGRVAANVTASIQANGAANLTWSLITFPGKASQVAIGANDTFWVLAADKVDGFNNSIYRWSPTTRAWQKMPGLATEVAVGPNGNAWILNNLGQIFAWNGNGWTREPGSASDIAIGANGSAWIITNNSHNIALWSQGKWQTVALPSSISYGAFDITVDQKGNPWIADTSNDIFKYTVQSKTWSRWGTTGAYDLAVGADGALWKLSGNAKGGYTVYYWAASGWVPTNGGAEQIAVSPSGHAWVVNSYGQLITETTV